MIRITKEEESSYRRLDPEKDLQYDMSKVVAFRLEPSENASDVTKNIWEDVIYYAEGYKDPTNKVINPNWVYVMVNPSMPDICKIGFTTTSVLQRAKEINSSTGVITPWIPIYSYKCPNGRMLEEEIHEHLEIKGVRVNDKREGFYIDSDEAIEIIESLGSKYQTK